MIRLGTRGKAYDLTLAAVLVACSSSENPGTGVPSPSATASPPSLGTGVNASTGGPAGPSGASGMSGVQPNDANAQPAPVGDSGSGPVNTAGTPGTSGMPGTPGTPGVSVMPGPGDTPIDMQAGSMEPVMSIDMGGAAGAGATDMGAMSMDGAGDGAEPEPPLQTGTCLQGSGDFFDKGPYAVKTKVVTVGSKGDYTIFYPDPLEENCPHPIVAWGNGTFITGGTAYDHFHNHAASWGIVTISSHNSSVGDGTFQTAGIDYLLAQNEDASSEFFGKLSTRAGVSGHSQGGAGADEAAAMHENVEAINNVQGSFGTPPDSDAALLCLTGTDDIQPTGCPQAVRAATVPALCASWDGADHVGTTLQEGEGIEQYLRLNAAWFRCFLADDTDACAMFMGGADCPVCKEPGWEEIFANNY